MDQFSGNIQFDKDSLLILNICIAFILFGIALDLKIKDFKLVLLNPKAAIGGFLSQFLLLPALTFLLVVSFDVQKGYALGMMLVSACPGGNISNFISHLAKANTALSISLTALATVSAVVLTPFNFLFWSGFLLPKSDVEHFALNPIELTETIFFVMAIPVLLGMVLNYRFDEYAKRLKKPVRIFSLIIFISFIVIALSKNYAAFQSHFTEIFLLVLVHNTLAYSAGYGMAYVLKLPLADRKTITIETGIQNSALALVVIFTFFKGAPYMALIAAWWGVWHSISGSILAFYWAKRS